MNRYLIADTPLGDNDYVAIIQTTPPQAIIECIEGHDQFTTPYRHYSFVNIHEETEDWTLRVHYMHNVAGGDDHHHVVVDKLLNRAWRYYRTYMQRLDRKRHSSKYGLDLGNHLNA